MPSSQLSGGQPGWLSQPEKPASGWDFLPCPDVGDRARQPLHQLLVGPGGVNAALRCASSCQPCSRENWDPPWGLGRALYEAFPELPGGGICSWRRTLRCSPGLTSNTELMLCLSVFFFISLDCEPLKIRDCVLSLF